MWSFVLAGTAALQRTAPATGSGLLNHMRAASGAVLIVDGNNVRGADCFGVSQEGLSKVLTAWSSHEALSTILMLDHGTEQHAWPTGSHTIVTFAGPGQTADDLIVRDSLWLRKERQQPVFVITSDAGLIVRTKQYRSASCAGVQTFPSKTFANLLLGDRSDQGKRGDAPKGTSKRRSARDREAERARRKETTAMREVAAASLSELLQQRCAAAAELREAQDEELWLEGDDDIATDAAPEDAPTGGTDQGSDGLDASTDDAFAVGGAGAPDEDLAAYMHWVNELAPRGRRHADPVGLAPNPSMKRRLRRQRHRVGKP